MRRALPFLAAIAASAAIAAAAPPDDAAAAPHAAHASASSADATAARRATRWLARRPTARMAGGQQADVIVSLRMAGTRPAALRSRLGRLARVAPSYATTPGAAAKVVTAAATAGADPRRLGGVDYLARMRRGARGGRFGRTTFDQSLSMIALRTARRPVPKASVRALVRGRSGVAWSFDLDPGDPPDVDSTAAAVLALRAAGISRRNAVVRRAVTWLQRRRVADGGWPATGRRTGNANSTGLAARALLAGGRNPAAANRFLRSLQRTDGAIRHTRSSSGDLLLATLDAAPALARTPLPPRAPS